MLKTKRFNLPLTILFILFTFIILARAWVCDDAYITLRTVDNFINGYGLTWNVAERVQSYTHPLWLFLLSAVYLFTREPFWTSIMLSLLLSLVTAILFVSKIARSSVAALFGLLILTLSNAFVDYATSGLENPLTHLLLAAFLSVYLIIGKSLRSKPRPRGGTGTPETGAASGASLSCSIGESLRSKPRPRGGTGTPETGVASGASLSCASSLAAPAAKDPRSPTSKLARRPMFLLALCAALVALNRLDTLLLVAPPLVHVFITQSKKKSVRHTLREALLGSLPLVLWEGFSLFYYGFLFPNTAFAKLATGIPVPELIAQGGYYLLNTLQADPLTLVIVVAAIVLAFFSNNRRQRLVVAGIVLYLLYLIRIGGDFAGGRFLTAPFFCATVILSRCDLDTLDVRLVLSLFAIVIVIGAGAVHPTFYLWAGDLDAIRSADFIDDKGIADERMWYNLTNSLARANRNVELPTHRWKFDGLRLKAGDEAVVIEDAIGMVGFYAGPGVHIVDQWALADPLLARLPAYRNVYWRIGHFDRIVPRGYLETLRSGENQIADPNLAQYDDKLALITRGRLFDLKRLVEIWRMNTGQYDHLIDFDAYRYPHLVRVDLARVSEPREAGTMTSDPANTPFYDHGVEIDLGGRHHADQMQVSLDSNDVYQLVYLDGDVEVAASKIPAPFNPLGLAVHHLDVPSKAAARGYDRIRILPLLGDDNYVLGHLALQ